MLSVSVCRSASVAPLTPTYHLWSPAGDKPWYLHRGKTAAALHLNLTLGETNEGTRSHQESFLAPLPGTPSAKIGELHTTLYLCFLVLLVYLLVFIFVSFIKIYKKYIYLTVSSPPCLDEHVRTRFFAGIGSSRFPSKGWRKYEEGMGQNF